MSQLGRVFPCVISDVSESGARVRLKDPDDLAKMDREEAVQIIFDRLGEYKSLRATVAWGNQSGATLGLSFIDDVKVRHMVISKLMPNRWQLINAQNGSEENNTDG